MPKKIWILTDGTLSGILYQMCEKWLETYNQRYCRNLGAITCNMHLGT